MFYLLILLPLVTAVPAHYQGVLANPKIRHDGFLEDTDDVAAAKEAHLKVLGRADNGAKHTGTGETQTPYIGPLAKPTVLKSGYLADTEEVAAVKHHHLNLLMSSNVGQAYSSGKKEHRTLYQGPLFKPVLLKSGFIANAHDVTAAKKNHRQILQSSTHEKVSYNDKNRQQTPYHGPLFIPAVLKSGYLADTPEVAAAKDHHTHLLKSSDQTQKYSHEGKHSALYHVQLFRPVLLKTGYLADTPEVAAAKDHHLRLLMDSGHSHDYYNKER